MPDSPAEPDLSLVSSDALVEELARRYDHMLLVRESYPTEDKALRTYDYEGGISAVLGLAVLAQRHMEKLESPLDDPEESDE